MYVRQALPRRNTCQQQVMLATVPFMKEVHDLFTLVKDGTIDPCEYGHRGSNRKCAHDKQVNFKENVWRQGR